MTERKELYSIGEVSSICNISKKALRFYDKIGIISPDRVSDGNNYRFYSWKTLLMVPVIKYFKQMGFKLDEMKMLFEDTSFYSYRSNFDQKIRELEQQREEIFVQYTSVKDWYALILEAEKIIENKVDEVSVKFMENRAMIYMDQEFEYDYMDSIINIGFTNFIAENNSAITGPVIINYPSYREKMSGNASKIRIMQRAVHNNSENHLEVGGGMYISCYHVGPHEKIDATYQKMIDWAESKGYTLAESCYERYVTDYWTSRNPDMYVTEILIGASKG